MNNVPPETEKAPASPAVTAPTIAVPVSRDAVRMPLADDQRRDLSREYSTSPTSSAAPGDSPFYNRVFWASYKGLSRGLLGGLLLGAV
ncbi:MAG: hypothetical protein K2Q12_04515, partial [Rickettsiales bacterium]|nr:hypothetical protein [Rickettsiales bacterium]